MNELKNKTNRREKDETFADRISLEIWEEVVGDLIGFTSSDGVLEIEIGLDNKKYKLEFSNDTENIREKLNGVEKGRRIGILRTENDVRLRTI